MSIKNFINNNSKILSILVSFIAIVMYYIFLTKSPSSWLRFYRSFLVSCLGGFIGWGWHIYLHDYLKSSEAKTLTFEEWKEKEEKAKRSLVRLVGLALLMIGMFISSYLIK